MNITKQIVEVLRKDIVQSSQYKESLDVAKIAFLDYIASYSVGLQSPKNQKILRELAENKGTKQILLTSYSTSRVQLALILGYLAHYEDLDDVQANFRGHPSAVIFSALLSVSDKDGGFQRMLEAYIQGVEFAGRIGQQFQPHHVNQGWHSTATIGCLAAAVAIGYYKKLSIDEFAYLLSLSTSQASGFLYQEGTDGKPLNAGFAARNAVQSYELVKLGMTAYDDIFSLDKGWMQVINQQSLDFDSFLDNWLEPSQILSPGLWFKQYPFCSAANGGFDLAQRAYRLGLRATNISKVDVHFSSSGDKALSHRFPKIKFEGKFSIEYILWLTLKKGSIDLTDFTEEKTSDDFLNFARKVVRYNDLESSNTTRPVRLVIRGSDKIIFDQLEQYPKGSPDNPLSPKELYLKFQKLTEGSLDDLYNDIMTDKISDTSEIFEKLSKGY
ncbi:hypothetical protein Si034_01911 [Streptococcus infantarius subsp. infantarius]|nr:hypothetical protein [Streptococcus infantarius subsp. infantarius]MCO4638942.1 hypothetical protein [Streptococcus infantarius subsp. infantarius]MCO4641947.1 hypothetical protein [Streptococcus infantarius subsp. infantarius]MCO4642920.1 hypothetical protein [Streptococcus infantarius subsp. infantarius]MCO4650892.1 hypothetical protein [Streptococcus infantarius subsp. infantarius]